MYWEHLQFCWLHKARQVEVDDDDFRARRREFEDDVLGLQQEIAADDRTRRRAGKDNDVLPYK